jgi:hypothetical protein
LLARHKYSRDAYTEAKGAFIRACTAKARNGKEGCESIDCNRRRVSGDISIE